MAASVRVSHESRDDTSRPDETIADPAAIPENLSNLSPGAELGSALAGIDITTVSGYDAVEVMKACYRHTNTARARFLHAFLEVSLRKPFSGQHVARTEIPGEFATDEARAALIWSRRHSDATFELAWDLFRRLPLLGKAMLSGELDEPRARAFLMWTRGLPDSQRLAICHKLLPIAMSMTVGELIEQIKKLAIEADPQWAERRYREAVRRRRVVGVRNDDGTANVNGLDLPVDRAAAACARIDYLARACNERVIAVRLITSVVISFLAAWTALTKG